MVGGKNAFADWPKIFWLTCYTFFYWHSFLNPLFQKKWNIKEIILTIWCRAAMLTYVVAQCNISSICHFFNWWGSWLLSLTSLCLASWSESKNSLLFCKKGYFIKKKKKKFIMSSFYFHLVPNLHYCLSSAENKIRYEKCFFVPYQISLYW